MSGFNDPARIRSNPDRSTAICESWTPEPRIFQVASEPAMPPTDAARFLVQLANLRGGPDNITVVLIQVDHADVA